MLNSIFVEGVTVPCFFISLGVALVLGVLISLVFRYKSKVTASFTLTLTLLPVVVAIIIMLVNGNIGAGVAVAGAFALVRFRSIPGSARDICAIFAAVVLGIATGMGYIGIAGITFVAISVIVIALTSIQAVKSKDFAMAKCLKIAIPENYDYDGLFDETFKKFTNSARLDKVRTSAMGTVFNLTYTVVLKGNSIPKAFIDELRSKNGNLPIAITDIQEEQVL